MNRLKMDGVDPEDALKAFMKVDPERVKKAAQEEDTQGTGVNP